MKRWLISASLILIFAVFTVLTAFAEEISDEPASVGICSEHRYAVSDRNTDGHTLSCDICASETAEPHDYADWTTLVNSDCTHACIQYRACTVCGWRQLRVPTHAWGHNWADWRKIVTDSGEYYERFCSTCGMTDGSSPIHRHSYVFASITEGADCGHGVKTVFRCVCGAEEERIIGTGSGHLFVLGTHFGSAVCLRCGEARQLTAESSAEQTEQTEFTEPSDSQSTDSGVTEPNDSDASADSESTDRSYWNLLWMIPLILAVLFGVFLFFVMLFVVAALRYRRRL